MGCYKVKRLSLGLIVLFALAGIIFYNNMMHLACVVSLFLALAAGVLFTLQLNQRNKEKLEWQEELRKQLIAVSTNLRAD